MTRKQQNYISQVERYLALKNAKAFTPRQLAKLVEFVACAYIYNVDMKTGTPQEQRLLKNIYFILTGHDDPEDER